MNRKKLIILVTIVICSIIVSAPIFANKLLNSQDDLKAKSEVDKRNSQEYTTLTKKQQESKSKIEAKLNDAWKDIKGEFNIKEESYLRVDLGGISDVINGKYPEFNDPEYIKEINCILDENLANIPQGSLIPNILLKKDKTEILYTYKLADGSNSFQRYYKDGESWISSAKTIKSGKAVLTN